MSKLIMNPLAGNSFNAEEAKQLVEEVLNDENTEQFSSLLEEIKVGAQQGHTYIQVNYVLTNFTIMNLRNRGFRIGCEETLRITPRDTTIVSWG
jgi:hypothetical protein